MSTKRIAKLVCFGQGGDTVEYGGGCHASGYGTPESPHAAANINAPDGTPVIDKRPALETEAGLRHVFRGPMVNVDLPDGDYDPCPKPSALFANAIAENSYGTMLAMQEASRLAGDKRGPLDSVSTREYIEGWRAVGAKIGHYKNGIIVWEN